MGLNGLSGLSGLSGFVPPAEVGGGIDPPAIDQTNLAYHWAASQNVTVNGNSEVTSWGAYVGTGDLVPVNSSFLCPYDAENALLNTKPTVNVGFTNKALRCNGLTGLDSQNTIVMFVFHPLEDRNGVLLTLTRAGQSSVRIEWRSKADAVANTLQYSVFYFNGSSFSEFSSIDFSSNTTYDIYTRHTGTNYVTFISNTQMHAGVENFWIDDMDTGSGIDLNIGMQAAFGANTVSSDGANGYLTDVIMYSGGTLNDNLAACQNTEAILATYYDYSLLA